MIYEQRHDLAEHFSRAQSVVQQDQRFTSAVNFVIEVYAVHRSITGLDGNCGECLSECEGRCRQDSKGGEDCDEASSQHHSYMSSPTHTSNEGRRNRQVRNFCLEKIFFPPGKREVVRHIPVQIRLTGLHRLDLDQVFEVRIEDLQWRAGQHVFVSGCEARRYHHPSS